MNSYRYDLLESVGKVGIGYFIAFSVFYLIIFVESYLQYSRSFSSLARTDVAATIIDKFTISPISGHTVFVITGSLAVACFGFWLYTFCVMQRSEVEK